MSAGQEDFGALRTHIRRPGAQWSGIGAQNSGAGLSPSLHLPLLSLQYPRYSQEKLSCAASSTGWRARPCGPPTGTGSLGLQFRFGPPYPRRLFFGSLLALGIPRRHSSIGFIRVFSRRQYLQAVFTALGESSVFTCSISASRRRCADGGSKGQDSNKLPSRKNLPSRYSHKADLLAPNHLHPLIGKARTSPSGAFTCTPPECHCCL